MYIASPAQERVWWFVQNCGMFGIQDRSTHGCLEWLVGMQMGLIAYTCTHSMCGSMVNSFLAGDAIHPALSKGLGLRLVALSELSLSIVWYLH